MDCLKCGEELSSAEELEGLEFHKRCLKFIIDVQMKDDFFACMFEEAKKHLDKMGDIGMTAFSMHAKYDLSTPDFDKLLNKLQDYKRGCLIDSAKQA